MCSKNFRQKTVYQKHVDKLDRKAFENNCFQQYFSYIVAVSELIHVPYQAVGWLVYGVKCHFQQYFSYKNVYGGC